VAGSYEHFDEPLGSIKDEEFLYQLSDFQVVKKDSASCSYERQTFVS
jgi:hypothetical protein